MVFIIITIDCKGISGIISDEGIKVTLTRNMRSLSRTGVVEVVETGTASSSIALDMRVSCITVITEIKGCSYNFNIVNVISGNRSKCGMTE